MAQLTLSSLNSGFTDLRSIVCCQSTTRGWRQPHPAHIVADCHGYTQFDTVQMAKRCCRVSSHHVSSLNVTAAVCLCTRQTVYGDHRPANQTGTKTYLITHPHRDSSRKYRTAGSSHFRLGSSTRLLLFFISLLDITSYISMLVISSPINRL